jgi:alpha-tubulin suppressor-like RCC1 family protein
LIFCCVVQLKAAHALSLSAGGFHTLALQSDGSLWAWGDNSSGQLGDGSKEKRLTPVKVGDGYAAVSCGYYHTLAIAANGTLYSWGRNSFGQLGNGTTKNSSTPRFVGEGYVAVAAGVGHSLGLATNGSLYAWGYNFYGQLGDGSQAQSRSPVHIGEGYQSIAAGSFHSLAVKSDGSLWAWGYNVYGQVGNGTYENALVPVRIGEGFVNVEAGRFHSLAVKNDGSLWAWGKNDSGQLGDGSMDNRSKPVLIGSGYSAAAAGDHHSIALKSDGGAWTWGENSSGQLGDGTTAPSTTPKNIGHGYTSVSAGNNHSLSLQANGNLLSWGRNSHGQIGDGSTENSATPIKVGAETLFDVWGVNTAPNTPNMPTGPESGMKDTQMSFAAFATDPDGDALSYRFNWGDGKLSAWGNAVQSHSWDTAGLYDVAAQAMDPEGAVSPWSAVKVVSVFQDNRAPLQPIVPSAANAGTTGISMVFSAAAEDPDGDALSYRFDWGDGSISEWGGASQTHVFTIAGTYSVTVQARDPYTAISPWSQPWAVEIVQANTPPHDPEKPAGPESGDIDEHLSFTVSTTDPDGDKLDYRYDWGDGLISTWGNGTRSHAWAVIGTYMVRAQARDDEGAVSEWSADTIVVIAETNRPPEMPTPPAGFAEVKIAVAEAYSTAALDPDGDSITYRFDWGDGTVSDWGPALQQHAWSALGSYIVSAQAKDSADNISPWSPGFVVNVSSPFSQLGAANRAPGSPSLPVGSDIGMVNSALSFTTSAVDEDGDALSFRFDWGDGSISDWGSAARSYAWQKEGTFLVKAQAMDEPGESSEWSPAKTVTISRGNRVPTAPNISSPAAGTQTGVAMTFTAVSYDADGDSMRYRFNWGDGGVSGWSAEPQAHAWTSPGTYQVQAQTLDAAGGASEWSHPYYVTILKKNRAASPATMQTNISWILLLQ